MDKSKLKVQSIIIGVIIANILPLFFLVPKMKLFLTYVYLNSALFAEKMFHFNSILVFDNKTLNTICSYGYLVTVPFWTLAGIILGYLFYKINKNKKYTTWEYIYRFTGLFLGIMVLVYFVSMILLVIFSMI
jgi:hypothetical protein